MLCIIKQMALLEGNLQLTDIVASGTFVATSNVTLNVAVSRITATSVVVMSLNTVGGTILGHPYLMTLTAGTGFGVRAGASDTSTYNYIVYDRQAL